MARRRLGPAGAATRARVQLAGRALRRSLPRLVVRLRRLLRQLVVRLRGLLGGGEVARQSLVALALNSTTSLIAGAFLGAIAATLDALPGLLMLVPAAIGLRGNIFSAFGNRLSTTIHTGTFELSARRDGVLAQNVGASLVLTLSMSVLLAVVVKTVAVGLGLANTISFLQLALISTLGGFLASLVVLVAAVALAAGSARYGWDLDNVTAPLVSTLGDVLTLPALWLATFLVDDHVVASVAAVTLIVVSAVVFVLGWRSTMATLRGVVRESTPILFVAMCLSTLSGLAIEHRLETFTALPALLVLLPAFISSAGALGGILSARLASKLHLGMIEPRRLPGADARRDGALVFLLGAPVFLFNAVGAHLVGRLLGQASPGLVAMVVATMGAGALAVGFVVVIAYYGTVAAVGIGVDPDTYGIPVVTSSVDFFGAVTLIWAISALGVA